MNEIPILNIDEEFESVIPPLDDEEFDNLKTNILRDGEIYHPLIVWNNTIVDGHHRYKILKEHPEIKFRISEKQFANRYEAIAWICLNQLGRRNLSDVQKTALMGRRYKAEKESHGSSERFKQENPPRCNSCTLEKEKHPTATKIAKEMNVSPRTVAQAEKFVDGMDAAEKVLPGISKEILTGKIKPTKADVSAIAKAPVEERKQMAEQLRVKNELSEEEKEQRKNKRDLMKALKALDATHMADGVKKIDPDNILDIFQSEVDKVIESMNFCFAYFPQLLTEQRYLLRVKELVKQLNDYIKDLEENRYEA